jgi:MHS family alpha-ketoglutarate permease-like MFS transporter
MGGATLAGGDLDAPVAEQPGCRPPERTAQAVVSFYSSIGGLIKAEMFPIEVRALAVGLSYAVANAAFGGSAEFVALWLKSLGREEVFLRYVTAMCGLTLLVSLWMPDPSREGYLRDEP